MDTVTATPTEAELEAETRILHSSPCPGCGCEPEARSYYRRAGHRIGYHCTCGAVVIDGIVTDSGIRA